MFSATRDMADLQFAGIFFWIFSIVFSYCFQLDDDISEKTKDTKKQGHAM